MLNFDSIQRGKIASRLLPFTSFKKLYAGRLVLRRCWDQISKITRCPVVYGENRERGHISWRDRCIKE